MRINRNSDLTIADRPLTAQRRLILDILREADGHLHAKELYRRAAEKDREISLATVYRNLRLFKDLGLVRETHLDDLRCYYEVKRPSEHYHLVCTACGQVTEFETSLVARLVAEVERTCGFHADRAILHLEGRCDGCKKG